MLDDANVLKQRDPSGALELAVETPAQLAHAFGFNGSEEQPSITTVVYSAMGGSALQAELARTFPKLDIPFIIVKDYDIPDFVSNTTLFIAASYSGNTEETLSSLEQARAKGAHIVVMSGGGKLQQQAEQHGDPFILIPKAIQPRMATFYGYRALVEVFIAYGLAPASALSELDEAAKHLESEVEAWRSDTPLANNPAKRLALHLAGKTPIVYAGTKMAPAAYKWKISFNESSKNTSWHGVLPEFDHNEFLGWSSHPVDKPFAVLDLVSSFEHPRTLKRFEVGDRLLSGMRPKATRIDAKGESELEQMLYLVVMGDFVSLYLGILNGVDPSPVALVEKLKTELN